MMQQQFDVAIIGGGFSGLMTAYHLASEGPPGLRVAIFEPSEILGLGEAYRTSNLHHLLNVVAGRMSALPDDSDHFLGWLNSADGISAAYQRGLKTGWQANDFAPRILYGDYLQWLTVQMYVFAKKRGISVQHVREIVSHLNPQEGGYLVRSKCERKYIASHLVLALGNPTVAPVDTGLITDVWNYNYAALAGTIGPVAIIGTGLTMVDTLMSLRDGGYKGLVWATSRRGLLPQPHDLHPAIFASRAVNLAQQKNTLLGLMRELRAEIRAAAAQGVHWQRVLDQWRLHLPVLWASLSVSDQKKFFSRLFSMWGVHRHRMAPEITAMMQSEMHRGSLKIMKGAAHVRRNNRIDISGKTYDVQAIFDCRGLTYHPARNANPLIQDLLAQGLLRPHPTGWGIQADTDFNVAGNQTTRPLYLLGSLLTGARLETIAVPELRGQAQFVARRCLTDQKSLSNSGICAMA
ncbi:MAG: FAD-dependent oxidoreductase [Alphaproteobacteria bacterium]|nr:FAD-dependent oxidoreductase [Alphaproteobacteria bacterium]